MALHEDEASALAGVLVAAYPALATVIGERRIDLDVVSQRFFSAHRIVRVAIRKPFPPEVAYVALGGPLTGVLSKRIDSLRAVARVERPPHIETPEGALGYAHLGDHWTSEYGYGHLIVHGFDDIPWRKRLEDHHQAKLLDMQETLAARIGPESIEPKNGGFVVTSYVIAHQRLIYRELTVPPDGQLERRDEILAENIPVYQGKLWGQDARGRMVPTG